MSSAARLRRESTFRCVRAEEALELVSARGPLRFVGGGCGLAVSRCDRRAAERRCQPLWEKPLSSRCWRVALSAIRSVFERPLAMSQPDSAIIWLRGRARVEEAFGAANRQTSRPSSLPTARWRGEGEARELPAFSRWGRGREGMAGRHLPGIGPGDPRGAADVRLRGRQRGMHTR